MRRLVSIIIFLLQPGRCLYTTVRELVENSLDAAESISELPEVSIIMYELAIPSARLAHS